MRTGVKRQAVQDQAGASRAAGGLALPRVAPGGVEIAHRLYQAVPVRLRLVGVDIEFAWQYVEFKVAPALAIKLSLGGHRFLLRITEPSAIPGLMPLPLLSLPEVSRKVLLAGLLEPVIARLEQSLGMAWQIESVEPVGDWGDDGTPRFTISDVAHLPGIAIAGTVEAEKERDWAFWQHLFVKWPLRTDVPAAIADIARIRCSLGRTRIAAAELRGIPVGSLLLIEDRPVSPGGLGVVLTVDGAPPRAFRGDIKGSGIEIVSEEPQQSMQRRPGASAPDGREATLQVAPAGAMGAKLQSLDEMNVAVEFDLGEQTAPLSMLKQVRPGFVFRLSQPIEQASVRIQANGQTIGYGQLVSVGDVLGVRVTSLLQDVT